MLILVAGCNLLHAQKSSNSKSKASANRYFIDVHYMEPGNLKIEDVAEAHKKDLQTQGKYGVNFIRYWVDEKNGVIYCLSSATDSNAVKQTHAEAHGLRPALVYEVTSGEETPDIKPENLFLDIHYLGEGKVSAADVAEAHTKDLAVEGKNGVRFINYWVDVNKGVVFCLSQAANGEAVSQTHEEAHGLVPATVVSVKQGN